MKEFTVSLPQHNTKVLMYQKQTEHLFRFPDKNKVLYVCDSNTGKLLPSYIENFFIVPAGEKYKNRDTVKDLSTWALNAGADRDTVFVAFGGGVVCDITAFFASIFMRGTEVILIPTSLLAMVDAALGGKTGIDFEGYKNILGTFFPAREVRIIPGVLKTLPKREYRGGLAEVIKHGLLLDADLLDMLRNRRQEILAGNDEITSEMIYRSMLVKKSYIEEDPFEKGIRGHLNLGHTFAHALESSGGLSQWTHGEAVAWGISRAMQAGVLMSITDTAYAEEVNILLKEYGFQTDIKIASPEELIDAMQRDKKRKAGKVRFILQEKQGCTLYKEIPFEILQRVLTSNGTC